MAVKTKDIKKMLRTARLLGLGVSAYAKEGLEKALKSVKKSDVHQGKKLVSNVLKETKKRAAQLESKLEKKARASLKKRGITPANLRKLRNQIAALERQLA